MEFAAILGAIAAAAGTVGTGAWKLIDRADKRRERREIKVEELLKSRVAALEAEKSTLEGEKTALRRYCSKVKSAAGKWREQLVANHIEPDPTEWPEEQDV